VPGEKKAWAKKARRRHSVAPTKFTHHEGDKLLGRSTPFAEEIAEEVDEETVEDSAEEAVEEAVEDSAVEEVTKGDKLPGRSTPFERQGDKLPGNLPSDESEDPENESPSDDKLPGRSSSDEPEEPENESPSESLPLDDSPENEQAEEIVEELEVIEEQPDQADEEQPEELAEEQLEQADETPFIDSDEEPIEEEIADELVDEETAEEAVEEAEDPAEDLGEYVDELSRELDALDEQKGDKLPGRSSSFERPKRIAREKPTKRMKPAPAPTPAPAPAPAPEPTKREKPKPAPTPAAAARQKPTKRKKPAPRYRYIKSPSLEQAFRNLLRLDAGAAWRATRIPLVAFFLCFALLALAIADQAPAIDSFNATINALVHGTRGMLDGFFVTITTLGDLLPMTALCLIVCAILVIARKWDSLAFFATNVLLAVVCVQALKFIFAVPRPGAETLVPIPGSFSFPSAHSFCSLIVLGMIGLLIFRALNRKGVPYNVAIVPGIILVIFAILIGISRIYVGVHWPSDVLGGWLLAGMWLPFASALYTVGARKR
jgi:undecaprenyl-diphosphatase